MKVIVAGASGYIGGELLRLLLKHPHVEVAGASSDSNAGKRFSSVHPNLRFSDKRFCRVSDLPEADFAFLALPHAHSFDLTKRLAQTGVSIVNKSGDFRLADPDQYRRWYKIAHPEPELQKKFVYGLPELFGDQIAKAKLVAAPGCLATATTLAAYPLVASGLVDPQKIVAEGKIGSSAAGASPDLSTHHPLRSGVMRSYKPSGHRHTPEIEQALSMALNQTKKNPNPNPAPAAPQAALAQTQPPVPASPAPAIGASFSPRILLSATAVETVRGILCTAHGFLNQPVEEIDIWRAYRSAYADKRFVRIIKDDASLHGLPEPKLVRGTNYCDVGFALDARNHRVVSLSALDNLMKGGAGQGVQCMNLMNGFPEDAGLGFEGLHPQ